MSRMWWIVGRCLRGVLFPAAAAVAMSLPSINSPAAEPSAETPEPVMRVEEDWKLILNVPADTLDTPQFHTTMSPYGDLSAFYVQVVWNYRDTPDFRSGGLEIKGWHSNELVRSHSFDLGALSTDAETVSWTQTLDLSGDHLSYEISAGESATWGAFGGSNMRIQGTTSLTELNAYSTQTSVDESCITFGSNRVDMLVITQVRRYAADGSLLSVDDTARVVYEREQ